ncbi:hypothetical protein L249_8319 [Ophiocordyceps polyrhachis-furcata BCC 54312]|uniref:Uncharacterized protein n=1 Tax=Ophiocordyceps polyrhachis-furcata BCC 54312 TaxID=1330021 RepID=A0A367KZC8_9HYPO|nr:hypothetical protein L249_8319 [Ophiocordyceps polyrhachis-furcata BCC 54312]
MATSYGHTTIHIFLLCRKISWENLRGKKMWKESFAGYFLNIIQLYKNSLRSAQYHLPGCYFLRCHITLEVECLHFHL